MLTEFDVHKHYATNLEELAKERGRNRSLRAMMRSLPHHPAGRLDEPDEAVSVWSDLHLGHANIIRYCERPFDDVGEMDGTLWRNMHAALTPDTTLVIVGDLAMGRAIGEASGYGIRALPCRARHLVVGNHDLNGDGRLRASGFDHVWSVLVSGGQPPLIWTHYPLRRVPEGSVNIHGHTHNKPPTDTPHINVSVEQLDYRPVRLSDLRALARELVAGRYPPGGTTLEKIGSVR